MASVRGVEGRGAFLREVVGSVGRWNKDFEVERFDLPPLRGGGRRGELFIVGTVKQWEIS